jgi:N-acetylglucosamine-6-phosphate deacetylase
LPAVAHTDAFFEQIEEALGQGFTHMTHLYSGMQGVRRLGGKRRAGAVDAAYTLDGLTVEAICDGIHLPGPLLRQIYRCIGPGRTALITDAMRAAGADCRESLLGSRGRGMKVLVEGGVAWLEDRSAFAGSVCTMDRAVRTMVREGRSTLVDAVAMAASTPAAIMGFHSKGRIEPGMDADMVLFDDAIRIAHVIIGGRRQAMAGDTGF